MTAPINHRIVLLGQSPNATATFAGFVSTSTGVFTSAATGGIQLYNTADRTTNTEYLRIARDVTNTFTIYSTSAGTGIPREVRLGIATGGGTTGPNAYLSFQAANNPVNFVRTDTGTSGTRPFVSITPTYNQTSGTAANTDFLINRTETAVGSGVQRLIDLQVGGVSKFAVNNVGIFMIPDGVTAPSALVGYVRFYVDTADGDLKVIFGDGVVKTLATDT